MYQVAVVGDRDTVVGYRAIGMTVVALDDPAEAVPALEALIRNNVAVIFLTETIAEQHEAYLSDLRKQRLPAIIPIPSMEGSTGFGMKQIQEAVRRAVGIDLFEQEADREDE